LVIVASLVGLAATAAETASPYSGQEQRSIKALSESDTKDLAEGNGLGLAKAAELNSYPGPRHVLELADELGLSDNQRTATQALYASMRERARRQDHRGGT